MLRYFTCILFLLAVSFCRPAWAQPDGMYDAYKLLARNYQCIYDIPGYIRISSPRGVGIADSTGRIIIPALYNYSRQSVLIGGRQLSWYRFYNDDSTILADPDMKIVLRAPFPICLPGAKPPRQQLFHQDI